MPQLAELAAWTAGYDPQFLEHLLHIDPTVLLRSDVATAQGTHKAELVAALLAGAEREEIFYESEYRRFYDGLAHSGLATQLRPYLIDSSRGLIARHLAFEIAERCRLPELVDDLFTVVRDLNEPQRVRESASDALCECIPAERLGDLTPMARGEVGPDPQDSIRGDALSKLVPAVWSVRDALPFIRGQRDRNFVGSYEMFLRYEFPKHLTDDDVIPILGRLAEWQACFDSLNRRCEFAVKAFCIALARLDEPDVAQSAVQVWHAKSRNYHSFAQSDDSGIRRALNADATRRAFAVAILNHPETNNDDIYHLLSSASDERGILTSHDLQWLLEAVGDATPERLPVWINAVQTAMWWWQNVSCFDLFLRRRAEIPLLADAFPLHTEIDAPESRNAKAQHLRRERSRQRLEKLRKPKPPLDGKRRVANDLRRFRSGDKAAWYHLYFDLSLKPGAVCYDFLATPIVETPGWVAATEDARAEFRQAARAFLLAQSDGYAKFGAPSNFADPGIHAIELLEDEIRQDAALKNAVARNWMRGLTGWCSSEHDRAAKLFGLAYAIDADAAISGVLAEAQRDSDRDFYVSAFQRCKACWDARLSASALAFIDSCDKPKSIRSVIEELSRFDRQAAEEGAGKTFARFQNDASKRECLVEVIAAAIKCRLFQRWEQIYTLLSSDDSLARDAFLLSSHDMERGLYPGLSEEQIADLYLLMIRLFPRNEDPESLGGFVSARQAVSYAKNGVLSALAERANGNACNQLLRLATELPADATWLRWRYVNTLNAKRRSDWNPLPVETIKRLTTDPKSRLINNEDDLLELIIESLERLQISLRGRSNPAVEELWNHDGAGNDRGNFRPKDEEFISDYIARWLDRELRRQGSIVNREVQPVRARRIDILVQTNLPYGQQAAPNEDVSLSVTIEVKGCWNTTVPKAVETQLVKEYLQPFGRTHGIYLVAWFVCPRWKAAKNSLGVATLEDAQNRVQQICSKHDGKQSPSVVTGIVLDARWD